MSLDFSRTRWTAAVIALVLTGAATAAAAVWWARPLSGPHHDVAFAEMPPAVAETYRFAHSHGDLMEHIPCYCGCERLGHTSLLDCFVNSSGGNAEHAFYCDICQQEARDAERLLADQMSTDGIRSWIDSVYGDLGPPTKTP